MASTPNQSLILNIVPVTFSTDRVQVGRVPYTTSDAYQELRERHRETHLFRYDARAREVLNVALVPDALPIGQVADVLIADHLLLAAKAVQRSILAWIAGGKLPILKGPKNLVFWGRAQDALLLRQACEQSRVTPRPEVEVRLRYAIDCRMFTDAHGTPFLGLVIDVDTANVIDLPVSELLAKGVPIVGCGVCARRESDHAFLYPGLDRLGTVSAVRGQQLTLSGSGGPKEVDAGSVFLEPRVENLERVIHALYGVKARAVLTALERLRQPVTTAAGQLARIEKTLSLLKRHAITFGNGVSVQVGALLRERDDLFPERITTERPILLFGPQGRNTGPYPDSGISTWGPYMYMQHLRNTPLVAVVCEARHRGRAEQFANALCNGFPDEAWRSDRSDNPFQGGLIGKFRLSKVRFEYEECAGATAVDYRNAARRLLTRLPEVPDLALVQVAEEFKRRSIGNNPYYATKAVFMTAGVPTQAIKVENMDVARAQSAYLLNGVALASYAKLGGIPWVISTPGSTTHELVLGMGSAEVADADTGTRTRYVGLTTLFQGDGRYLIWGLTREVEYQDYQAELLASLRTVLRHLQHQNAWEQGDRIRLICHVYKRLKNCEVDAVKALVRELVSDRFDVEFAFLDVSAAHPYRLFDPNQRGVAYRSGAQGQLRGTGIPARGVCLLLDRHRALMQLTGPTDVKTAAQGLPRPLLVELHSDSDFTDLTYLVRQIFHFTYTSWQSFIPATEPVTVKYSHRIASVLGNLKRLPGWSSDVVVMGNLRERMWFL